MHVQTLGTSIICAQFSKVSVPMGMPSGKPAGGGPLNRLRALVVVSGDSLAGAVPLMCLPSGGVSVIHSPRAMAPGSTQRLHNTACAIRARTEAGHREVGAASRTGSGRPSIRDLI